MKVGLFGAFAAACFMVSPAAGQKPHPVYALGMTRLSCKICIMSSQKDLETAARIDPAFLARMTALEREIGHTFMMPTKKGRFFLDELAMKKNKE